MIRNPSHAGTFYPRFDTQIKRQINSWLENAEPINLNERAIGLIVPHAGYMYSGQCASLGLHSLTNENIDAFIILHPCHSAQHFDFSISPFSEYVNPLGSLKLDNKLYKALAPQADQNISLSYHQNEHSMEIQLPLISYFFPNATILPIMIGNQIPSVSIHLAEVIHEAIFKESRRIVLICSTDLSHYHSSDKAENLDSELLGQVLAIKPEELWKAVVDGRCEACGIGGLMSLLYLAKKYSNPSARVVQYTHSGKVSGNNQQVVGYLAAKISV